MKTNTKTIDRIRDLKRHEAALETYFARYNETTSDRRCDKHHAAFNEDQRFVVFEASAWFTACTGYYGSSSCSTFGEMRSEIIRPHMTKYLNAHKEQIFNWLAKSIREEAASLVGKANDELDELSALLESAAASGDIDQQAMGHTED